MTELLTTDERDRLVENEMVIERGIQTFTEVGNALLEIRDGRLYRAEFGTFEDYCRERWGLSRTRSYELMSAARVVSAIADTGMDAPANEGQARELARVPEDERTEVWRETVERTGGKPTAAAIRETYRPEPAPDSIRPADKNPTTPKPEPGIWHSGPAAPDPAPDPEPVDEHAEGDARRDAELDAAMSDTAQRFRANFAQAARRAGEVTTFDAERTSEVFAGNWNRDVGDLLRRLRDWCDAVESAHRRQASGLRIVGGSQ